MRKYRALLQSLADRVQPAIWKWSFAGTTFKAQCVEAGRQVACMPKRSCKPTDCRSDFSRPQFQNFTVKITLPQASNMQLTCLTASIFHQE